MSKKDLIEKDDNEKTELKLYAQKCVTCIHLFPRHSDATSHVSCHYSKGNDMCPASELQFVVSVNKKSKIENIIESFESDDIEGAIRQLKKLTGYSKDEQKGILSSLKDYAGIKKSSKKKKEKSSK
jgi:hypothetical protein